MKDVPVGTRVQGWRLGTGSASLVVMSTDRPKIERGGSPYGACRDHTTCFSHGRAGAGPGSERNESGGTCEDFSPRATVLGSPLLFNVQAEKGTHKPVPTPKVARLLLGVVVVSKHSPGTSCMWGQGGSWGE